jgi:hypothetical protein
MNADVAEGLDEQVAEVLEDARWPWARRGEEWVVLAGSGLPCEVVIRRTSGGVRVEAVLATWDEVSPASLRALSALLTRAQAGLCFARAELAEGSARLFSEVADADVPSNLGHALGGVAAGARLLGREAGALLVEGVAEEYLRFFGGAA